MTSITSFWFDANRSKDRFKSSVMPWCFQEYFPCPSSIAPLFRLSSCRYLALKKKGPSFKFVLCKSSQFDGLKGKLFFGKMIQYFESMLWRVLTYSAPMFLVLLLKNYSRFLYFFWCSWTSGSYNRSGLLLFWWKYIWYPFKHDAK
jgi:hypothetical protein